jgi:hypothetical protein
MNSRMDIRARCGVEEFRKQSCYLAGISYMSHATTAPGCLRFNEISLLDHVPQTNRLDHVLCTKQLP